MPHKINIPNIADFLGIIAGLYQNASRIFMEYIDNSLDDAQTLYVNNNNTYPYLIKIDVHIDPERKQVTFRDNCQGMDRSILLRIIQDIGSSNKKAQSWTNGEFGFGIQSFRACAGRMIVISKTASMLNPLKIVIDRKENIVPDEVEVGRTELPYDSGTKVILQNFDRDWWFEVTLENLKNEIENHFERLLENPNLQIKIHYGCKTELCKAFNYRNINGTEKEFEIREISIKEQGDFKQIFPEPIKIYLKITEQIIPNKRPIFINKGRRIEEIQNVKSFRNKSKYKTALWGNDYLTGYIEVNGNLEPYIGRDYFKKNRTQRLVYDEILKYEDEINELIKAKFDTKELESLGKLEDILSSALSKLARLDSLKFRIVYSKGKEIYLESGGGGVFEENAGGSALGDRGGSGGGGGLDEGEGSGLVNGEGQYPGEGNIGPLPIESDTETPFEAKRKRKSGFNIKFLDSDPPVKQDSEEKLRSQYTDGTIYIFKKHPEFDFRMTRTHKGEPKLNHRLIWYLGSEISVWYKNVFYERKKMQPEIKEILNSREEMFKSQVEFIYEFEKALQPYVNKNLFTLEMEE